MEVVKASARCDKIANQSSTSCSRSERIALLLRFPLVSNIFLVKNLLIQSIASKVQYEYQVESKAAPMLSWVVIELSPNLRFDFLSQNSKDFFSDPPQSRVIGSQFRFTVVA